MKKSSVIYLQGKLGVWTVGDATKELGQYIGYRPGIPSTSVDIFAFDDPTKQFRKIELSFAKTNLTLAGIYAYPWKLSWDECKQLWGNKVKTLKNPDGSKFYEYKDRRLNVLVDKRGDVYNIGLY